MVRKAELAKILYMLVLGDKEAETQTVSVRSKAEGKTIGSFPLSDWLTQLSAEVAASLGG
jgi:threonyl-tRNA synthetase